MGKSILVIDPAEAYKEVIAKRYSTIVDEVIGAPTYLEGKHHLMKRNSGIALVVSDIEDRGARINGTNPTNTLKQLVYFARMATERYIPVIGHADMITLAEYDSAFSRVVEGSGIDALVRKGYNGDSSHRWGPLFKVMDNLLEEPEKFRADMLILGFDNLRKV